MIYLLSIRMRDNAEVDMIKFDSHNDDPEKKCRFQNHFRPAKYLVPAAVFAAVLAAGCNDTGTGGGDLTGDDDSTDNNNGTTPSFLFNAPVELTLNGTWSSISYWVFQPALADFDDDGDLDIFLGNAYSYTYYYSSSSFSYTGKAQSVRFYLNGDLPVPSRGISSLNHDILDNPSLPTNFLADGEVPVQPAGPMFTAVGDIDGDGDLEVIAAANYVYGSGNYASYAAKFFTYDYTSEGPVQNSRTYYSTVLAPALVDIDGDGDLDLVVGGPNNLASSSYSSASRAASYSSPPSYSLGMQIAYMRNDGTGDFYPLAIDGQLVDLPNVTSTPFLPVPSFVDVDSDGDQDMFVTLFSQEGTEPRFYRNTGSSSSPSFTEETIPTEFAGLVNTAGTAYFPAFGDADGDGDIDVLVGTDEPKLLFFENTAAD